MKIEQAGIVTYGTSRKTCEYAFARLYNELLAKADNIMELRGEVLMPTYFKDSDINRACNRIRKLSKEKNIENARIKGFRTGSVTMTAISLWGYGSSEDAKPKGCEYNDIIAVVNYIGIEAMLRIYSEKQEKIRRKFPESFLNSIEQYGKALYVDEIIGKIKEMPYKYLAQIGEGGIFKALYKFSEDTGRGFDVNLREIPILQETIELCEIFEMNPYSSVSTGAFLLVLEDKTDLDYYLSIFGDCMKIIGRVENNNDKIIRNNEEIRYLDRPGPDEIEKIYKEIR